MTTMRISELAERSGVPVTTLRFYDTVGLLPARRTPAGYRVYGADAAERLAFIGAAKRLGLPLTEVVALVTVWESGGCADVKAELRPRVEARLREAGRDAEDLAAWTAFLWTAPVACSLPEAEADDRVAQWRAVAAGARPEQIIGGVRLVLPADRAAAVAALAVAEQRCCPFLDFRLHFDGPVLRLEVRAPEVAASLLTGLFAPAA